MPRRPKTCFARIETLALLPVFHKLHGSPVLLVGGGFGAAWKAELLLAAGAQVKLCADTVSPAMARVIAAHKGAVEQTAAPWSVRDIQSARLAIMDTNCPAEAASFACVAEAVNVPVNVIDQPAFCTFQFGSIVNRSPAIIAISTDGAAPVLGQALRRRIEAILPQNLAGWTLLAKSLRARVAATYPKGPARRAFWERFVDRSFSGDAPTSAGLFGVTPACGEVIHINVPTQDPELLTLGAVRAMQRADLICFDEGTSPEVLELARREAVRRASLATGPIAAAVAAGETVVVLSTARSGADIAALEAHAIPVTHLSPTPWPAAA